MQIDAHYYAVLAMARSVGIEKETAHKIAYASQFVDDAKINHITLNNDNEKYLLEKFNEKPEIKNAATCHNYFKIDTFNYGAMVNNTAAFHFVPGCDGDNFAKKMRCKKESPIVMNILKEAKRDNDPIKLGIALHAYADTFSHQGFSGIPSKVNDVDEIEPLNKINSEKNIKEFLMNIVNDVKHAKKGLVIPAYGHAQVFKYSDIPYLKWKYSYDQTNDFTKNYREEVVDNKDRFQEAFLNIKKHLDDFLKNNPELKDTKVEEVGIEKFNDVLTSKKVTEDRINNWRNFLVEQELLSESDEEILSYDEDLWLKKAFDDYSKEKYCNRIVEDVKVVDDFLKTDWYKYYEATQWYKKIFFSSAEEHGLMIPNEYV